MLVCKISLPIKPRKTQHTLMLTRLHRDIRELCPSTEVPEADPSVSRLAPRYRSYGWSDWKVAEGKRFTVAGMRMIALVMHWERGTFPMHSVRACLRARLCGRACARLRSRTLWGAAWHCLRENGSLKELQSGWCV